MLFLFFFNDTATTEIYTLALHDALPISAKTPSVSTPAPPEVAASKGRSANKGMTARSCRRRIAKALRSEEHTSELQSRQYLVCRLLLEKKNKLNAAQRGLTR